MAILRVSAVTPDHAIGSFGSTILYVWRNVTEVQAIERLHAEIDVARAEGVPTLFGVVEAEAEVPPAEIRERLANLLRDFGDKGGVASALTFEGRGLRAAAVRNVATGLAIVARQAYPHRIFATAAAAADWLVTRMPRDRTVDPQTIVGAIEALRRR